MKNIVFVVLLIVVIAGGYAYINETNDQVAVVSSETDVMTESVAVESEDVTPAMEATTTADNLVTPSDMSEEAQREMYSAIAEYNKCMMQNRLEYHQQGVQVANVADKTLQVCEPHLDDLAAVLETNNVNLGLKENMIKTMRSRAVRKLMAAVMQSMAGQAAAAANAQAVVVE